MTTIEASARACSAKSLGRFALAFLVVALAVAWATNASTQTIRTNSQKTNWIEVPGRSVDVGISPAGVVYAIAQNGRIWRWGSILGEEWRRMPGTGFKRVDVDSGSKPWAVTETGDLLYYNGLWWERRGGGFTDVGAGGKRTVMTIGAEGALFRWDAKEKAMVRAFSANAARIDIDDAGNPWIVDRDGRVRVRKDGAWQDLPGQAGDKASDKVRDIGIGPKGTVYAAMANGTLAWWKADQNAWETIRTITGAVAVSLGPDDKPWVVLGDGKVLAVDLFQREREEAKASDFRAKKSAKSERDRRREAARDPALSTSNDPITFTKVKGLASKVAIGLDGSIFALSPDGRLTRWNNADNRFRPFPGDLLEIAVGPSGNPWGINRNQDIFRHDGSNWVNVKASKARDIAIGADGAVVIADAGEVVKRLDSTATRAVRVSARGRRVAAGPRGTIWTVRENGGVFRCTAKDECTRVVGRQGKEIAIGPDGSVFIVSPDLKLFRFDFRQNDWARVQTPASVIDVAVGPKGRPWIVDVANNVYAAGFFIRDESRDAQIARGTSRPTLVVAVGEVAKPTITFKKTIQFEEITFDDTPASTDNIGAGVDGSVFVLGDSGAKLRIYDEKRKVLENPTFSLPADAEAISSDAAGRIWLIQTAASGAKAYHQKKFESSSFDSYTVTSASGSSAPDLNVGGDGTVFVVTRDSGLYKFNAGKAKFEKFVSQKIYSKVAVTPDGRPWVIETDGDVKEYDGTKFVKPGGRSQTAQDIAIGANGSILIADNDANLKRWNATNKQFDDITITGTVANADHVAVQADGRPWYLVTSESGSGFRAKK